ncbi:MAG: purine-nucleoside phosphorylase [Odoribacter splanchnicus]
MHRVKHTIPYAAIPHFPVSTVQGHKGNLLIGKFGGKNVIAMQGRFHFYEGYSMQEVTFPIRVLHQLGVSRLFVSNAAGGVNTTFLAGDLMIITDHINLFPEHPLRGKNIDELGPRFPGMTNAYSSDLIRLAEGAGEKLGIQLRKRICRITGTFFRNAGRIRWIPSSAECRRNVHCSEIIVARRMNMECFGMASLPIVPLLRN